MGLDWIYKMDELPPPSADSLYKASCGFTDCLQVIVESNWGGQHIPGMGYLAGHSLEVALKSFLMLNGWTDGDIKKPKHNLIFIWAESEKLGLAIPKQIPGWVSVLNQYYAAPYQYRYPPHNHAAGMTEPADILYELREIQNLVWKEREKVLAATADHVRSVD